MKSVFFTGDGEFDSQADSTKRNILQGHWRYKRYTLYIDHINCGKY
jgi:hypothetical protein